MKFVKHEDDSVAIINQSELHLFTVESSDYLHLTDGNSLPSTLGRDVSEIMPITVGTYQVMQFGQNNQLPFEVRSMAENNALLPGTLLRKTKLLMGQGLFLYKTEIKDGTPSRVWTNDTEIETWMNDNNIFDVALKSAIEFHHAGGFFTKIKRARGYRVGLKMIASLESVSNCECFLEWPDDRGVSRNIIQVNNLYPNILNAWSYPVFDELYPFNYPIAMSYDGLYSYGRRGYSIPSYYGGRHWIKRSSTVPLVLQNLTDQSIYVKYHVKIPKDYWENAKNEFIRYKQDLAAIENKDYRFDPKDFEKFKDDTILALVNTLSGVKGVGKLFTSEYSINIDGILQDWKIESIDQKIGDFVTAQLDTSRRADFATLAAIGLHPALSNIGSEGKADSGSEQLYALKNYLLTDNFLSEQIVLSTINKVIKANWPNKGLKAGFFHDVPLKESNVSPSNRIKNNDSSF